MAELRNLDEKLAEVLGLAQAAQRATDKVAKLLEDGGEPRTVLEQMGEEAAETARRCEAALDDDAFDGRKTAITDKARETKQEATEMMDTYLGEDAEGLDGFEFLIMAEAGELGHWRILATLNERAGIGAVRELTDFAIPVQERHEQVTRETALAIAGSEDPLEES
jgi:phosphoribosyl-ATP pyrophosphohydrolase